MFCLTAVEEMFHTPHPIGCITSVVTCLFPLANVEPKDIIYMGAARLGKYIRNANPSNISSLSLKSPPFSPDPCSLVSLFHLLSRHTRTAPRRPLLASHTPVDSPGNQEMKKVKLSSPDQEMKRVKLSAPTLKSCAAMELAGELGLGSLSRDWMLVKMAETS